MKVLHTLVLALLAAPLSADTLVLSVPNVAGQSTVAGYEGAIDVGNYSFNAASFGGTAATSFSVAGPLDRAFPTLFLKCLKGTDLGTVTLSVIAPGAGLRAELELTSAVCTSVTFTLGDEESQSFQFEFAEATWQHFDPDPSHSGPTARAASSHPLPGARRELESGPAESSENCAKGIFLQIDDIKGDAEANTHKDWIRAGGAAWGAANFGGTRVFYGVEATGNIDRALPPTYEELINGSVVDPVLLELACGSAGNLDIELTNAEVRYTTVFGAVPRYSYVFEDYQAIEMTYTVLGPDGTPGTPVTVGWDLVKDQEF